MTTARRRLIARNLAVALLAGVWKREPMIKRLRTALGARRGRKIQAQLVDQILAATERRPDNAAPAPALYPPSTAKLIAIILASPWFDGVVRPLLRSREPLHMELRPPVLAPASPLRDLDFPALPTPGDVAAWLGLPLQQLDWFADELRQHRRTAIPDLQHYTYAFRRKPFGPPRLIEAPKPRLRTMQQRILHGILDRVPMHEAAHGFVKGRSCLTGAEHHVGAAVIVCFDIADFFLTTPLGRVHALFRSLGYPHSSARMLVRLCSTMTPQAVLDHVPGPHGHRRGSLRAYGNPHLPQGAPSSPAIANLVARRLDIRLTGLAVSLGGIYTRYADDLTFSGDADFARKTSSLIEAVAHIVEDEGYRLNERKTRVMTPSGRQRITGIVVNAHPNVARDDYDRLKAILHNCRCNGLDAENREGHPDFRAHLEGRVGWVEFLNPARGRKLRAMLARVEQAQLPRADRG
jgi:RNA-directed DNA polymerase